MTFDGKYFSVDYCDSFAASKPCPVVLFASRNKNGLVGPAPDNANTSGRQRSGAAFSVTYHVHAKTSCSLLEICEQLHDCTYRTNDSSEHRAAASSVRHSAASSTRLCLAARKRWQRSSLGSEQRKHIGPSDGQPSMLRILCIQMRDVSFSCYTWTVAQLHKI